MLCGSTDESYIGGHKRTYIGSILGRLIDGLKCLAEFVQSSWMSLLQSVKNIIANGSKEVAFAALVLRNPTTCGDMATNKVKKEIIHGLGVDQESVSQNRSTVLDFLSGCPCY
ncbi:hypothetical protein L1987_52838 [Smallanthus sonchifolius]|uniref:Uncharacterized protein n=1 Tax=Smallanthus sonchifolius TaxID=185202 RepID=A0ACB9EV11_9ASTR|nr:hypothetical protein L1987_52838 [Smallanthus sonchifolius]